MDSAFTVPANAMSSKPSGTASFVVLNGPLTRDDPAVVLQIPLPRSLLSVAGGGPDPHAFGKRGTRVDPAIATAAGQ